MKKIILIMMSLLVVAQTNAQDDSKLLFNPIDDQHASVAAQNEDIGGDIIIPSLVYISGKKYTVTAIADDGFKFTKITSVVLPYTIEKIGNSAFFWCKDLTGIVIPPSVEVIETDAFYYCSNLEYIQVIKSNPNFHNVGKAVVDNNNYIIAYPGKGDTELVIPDGIKGIRHNAFAGCESIRDVYIPSSVESVGVLAFNFCMNLRRVQWDASTSDVPLSCFHGSSSLEEIIISETVNRIGYMAFFGTSLKSITVRNRIPLTFDTSMGTYTFENQTFEEAIVYVPEGCSDAYRSAEVWGKFTHMEETYGGGWRRTIIISTLDGGTMEYLIDKHTKVRFDQPNLIIETDGNQLTYELEDMSQIRYGHKYITTGIHGEVIVNGQSFRMEDGVLLFENLRDNSLIEIYTVDGKAVMSRRYSGSAHVSLGQLAPGIYFVKVNSETYKILKK